MDRCSVIQLICGLLNITHPNGLTHHTKLPSLELYRDPAAPNIHHSITRYIPFLYTSYRHHVPRKYCGTRVMSLRNIIQEREELTKARGIINKFSAQHEPRYVFSVLLSLDQRA